MLTTAEVAPQHVWRISRERYHQLAELGAFEGRRVQLLFGTVVEMNAMGSPHAMAIRLLTRQLVMQTGAAFDVLVQLPLGASDDSEPEPDFAIVPSADRDLDDHPRTAKLVIEVAESSLKLDLGPKALLYASCKVPEYWVIDLASRRTVVHRSPRKGRYSRVQAVPWSHTLKSTSVPGVSVKLGELLGH